MVTISVLMPVLNGEKYLSAAIESILGQTFPDFEFLVLDDGSTDSTLKILRKYAAKDKRLRVISREHKGFVASLNELLGYAQGQFISRMDADDISLPDRFARQVQFLRDREDVVCVAGHFQIIDEEGRYLTTLRALLNDDEIQEQALAGHSTVCHGSSMMRREVLVGVGGYDGNYFPAEDVDLCLRLGEVGKLANLNEAIYKFRMRTNSISGQAGMKQLEAARAACERAWQRRGIQGKFEVSDLWRPGPDRDSQHKFALQYGWWAFNSRERQTAIIYGLRAIWARPFKLDGWKLFACALLKPFGAQR